MHAETEATAFTAEIRLEADSDAGRGFDEKDRVETEIAGARLLQNLSAQLVRDQGIESLYERILDGAKSVMRADYASMQRLHPERGRSGALRLMGFRQLSAEAAEAWQWVDANAETVCAAALRAGTRVIVTDVERADVITGTESLERYRRAGIRAVQSTPLISRAGEILGMISTHWKDPHRPTDHDLRLLDILARQAADLIERKTAEAALRKSEAWLAAQKEAFQAAVHGAPLATSLNILVHAVISQSDGAPRCAFYIADAEQTSLRHVVGMGEIYARHIGSFRIGPNSVACGLAAYTGQPVITADVAEEPRWKDWQWLAVQFDYRACWSFPVETLAGKVVGTFAMYFPEPRQITPRDREIAATLTQSAAIIISRHQEAEERARTATALQQNEARLRAADRQKDEFLAMLAHELRNPLAPIRNASEILSRMLAEDERAQTAVGMIKRQTAHLSRLVDDLLDVSRITQGRIQLRCVPLDLASVVSQALETVQPQLRAKQHRISITTSSYEPLYVNGDFARLVQCLGNLLSNAVKYTDPHGELRVQTCADDSSAMIAITDTGTGIAPELLPSVFDLFVQSERTLDRADGGLGIGLAVVRRLIEMHGGAVAASSAGAGQGSTFTIRLPRIERLQAEPFEAPPLRAPPRRVLVVDDNIDAANSLALLLGLQDHETRVAYSGHEALGLVDSFEPDVALVDLGLPRMNGYELAERLRVNPKLRGIRLVALTGYGQAEDRERTKAAGFDDHLVKPVDLPALERSLVEAAASQLRTALPP